MKTKQDKTLQFENRVLISNEIQIGDLKRDLKHFSIPEIIEKGESDTKHLLPPYQYDVVLTMEEGNKSALSLIETGFNLEESKREFLWTADIESGFVGFFINKPNYTEKELEEILEYVEKKDRENGNREDLVYYLKETFGIFTKTKNRSDRLNFFAETQEGRIVGMTIELK